MTKFASRIATGIAILGLAAPAFAATNTKSADASAPGARTAVVHHSKAHKHRKLAHADEKKVDSKKQTVKKVDEKMAAKKDATKAKVETPAAPSATPAPASK
jgi:hypothetical protein